MSTTLTAVEAQTFLRHLYEKNTSFYSDTRGRGALKDFQQTFPYPWLYVAELIQNAVDEGAKAISFDVLPDGSILFEHDGDAFSQKDVEALSSRGISEKGANTVGFMGIGFKSVFKSFETVQISSGIWRFSLTVPVRTGEVFGDEQRDWLGAVLPQWDNTAEPPSTGMTCRFVLSKRLMRLQPAADDLTRILGDHNTLLALLAWQGVKEIKWNGQKWMLNCQREALAGQDAKFILESLSSTGAACGKWILFSKEYVPSKDAVARFLEHRQLVPRDADKEKVYTEASRPRKVAVFCELNSFDCPIPVARGHAFALLPTTMTFPFGLNIQADWLLNVTRTDMMQLEGNPWHEEILDQLPGLMRYYLKWLTEIASRTEGQWQQGYEALPSAPTDNVSDEWFAHSRFKDNFAKELSSLSFLPALWNAGGVQFLPPATARILPNAFVKYLESPTSEPHALFGDAIVSTKILGVKARACLERFGLIVQLRPDELVTRWTSGTVRNWLNLFPEADRNGRHFALLSALAEMDDEIEWNEAPLPISPARNPKAGRLSIIFMMMADIQVGAWIARH